MEETLLDVEGMSCPSCVRHIDHALKAVDGVTNVDVRLREGRVLVKHEGQVSEGALVEALDDAGYASRPAA